MNTNANATQEPRAYVIARTDGSVDVIPYSHSNESFFERMHTVIPADMIEPVLVQQGKIPLYFFCNENGYAELDREKSVNRIASYIYSQTHTKHIILGNVVFCTEVDGKDGIEFAPLSLNAALGLCKVLETDIKTAADQMEIPSQIPDPKFEITGFDDAESFINAIKAMRGES